MSAVRYAIQKLDSVVEKLEGATDYLEQSLATNQRDMFPASSNQNEKKAMAKCIDNAIDQVEMLLREGA